jgi:hypothetical protein
MNREVAKSSRRWVKVAVWFLRRKLFWAALVAGVVFAVHGHKVNAAVMPDWVPNPVQWAAAEVLSALTAGWDWMLNVLGNMAAGFTDLITDHVPDLSSYSAYIAPFATLGAIINYWLPLSDLLVCIGIYWALSVGLILYRIVKSFVPTISG